MKRTSLKEKYLIFKVRQNKDANAYGQLYDYYVDRIFRFILFKVATTEEAEDLTSEVFLKTWEYINNTGKKIKNLNALLYKIARNKVIDYYRTKARHAVHSDEELMKRIEDQRNLLAEIETRLDVKSAEQYLKKLKDVYREVLILKYIEEYSIAEIAEIMEITKGNVRVLLHRALKAIKDIAGEK